MPEFSQASALSSAPSPMRRHRFVQAACLFSAVAHVAATLICVYTFKEGNLLQFSPVKLMQFVPEHIWLWRSSCLLVMLSSVSTLVFILAMREVLEEKYRFLVGIAVCFSLIACSQDLSAIARMMVLFSDVCLQGVLSGSLANVRADYAQSGWFILNESITQSFLLASFLYGMGGLCIALCLTRTKILETRLAFAHLPVWLVMIASSVTTFFGLLPASVVLLFLANLGISLISAFSGVATDAVLKSPLARAPGEASVDLDNSGFF